MFVTTATNLSCLSLGNAGSAVPSDADCLALLLGRIQSPCTCDEFSYIHAHGCIRIDDVRTLCGHCKPARPVEPCHSTSSTQSTDRCEHASAMLLEWLLPRTTTRHIHKLRGTKVTPITHAPHCSWRRSSLERTPACACPLRSNCVATCSESVCQCVSPLPVAAAKQPVHPTCATALHISSPMVATSTQGTRMSKCSGSSR